jgi:hypothetical protein
MWQWQYLRAQEIARERIAEADEVRRARTANRARQLTQPRWNVIARGVRRALPSTQ